MQRVIGIDFGTSTTYMNVKRYNGAQPDGDRFSYMPVMFNYGESSGYVATIVRENADGSFDFGEKASEPLEGSKIHTEIKMRLESPNEQERGEARRITGEFFKFLYETYTQQAANLGGADDTEETVISYPVKWQKETAQFMLDAARDAGFRNVRGMDEAEAAVATVLCQNSGGKGLIYADKPGYLMLIDMGAGTTDLVVCRYQAGAGGQIAIELVTSWPHSADEPTFGGREIDAVLEQYVEDYLTKSLIPALAPQAHIIAAAPGQAKMWKERNVSVTLAADKQVNTCAYIGTYKTMGMLTGDFPAFGRREFESFAESGLRDYARLISGCLEKTAEADENFSALDLVILTGGHSAWYFAKEILTGAMEGWLDHPMLAAVRENPYRVVSLPNPQTTVSLGLVYSKLSFKLERKEAKKSEQDLQRRLVDILNDINLRQKTEKHPSEICYKWDERLLPALKTYIERNNHFSVMNNVFNKDASLLHQLRKDLHLQGNEEVLFARIVRRLDENDNVEKIDGWIYSSKGIYTADLNIPESNFCPWETFMRFEDDPDVDAARKLVFDSTDPLSDTNEEIFFNADLYDMRDFLREKALELAEKAADQSSAEGKKSADTAKDLPTPEETFNMRINDIFTISGRGVVVDGMIASGKVAVGDRVEISGCGNVVKAAEVLAIAIGKEQVSNAGKGDHVGILLSNIRKQDIRIGMWLTAQEVKSGQPPRPIIPSKAPVSIPDGMYRLTLTRKKQYSGSLDHLYVQVDDRNPTKLAFGESVSLPVSDGIHRLSVWFRLSSPFKIHTELDISRDTNLTIEYSAIGLSLAGYIILKEGSTVLGKFKLKL